MTDKIKASDLIVRALENEGVDYIFAVPGEENLDMLESLRTSTIKLILTRHEQGAGFMAATHGRLTGRTGVCMATLGPGATNFVTCAAYAQLGAMPLLMITGQKPIKKSKQGRFQIVDIVRMMEPITKYTKQIVNVHTIPAVVREAFRLAEEERPGAVHLELPEDIAAEYTDDWFLFNKSQSGVPSPSHATIGMAVERILKAKNPLMVIGAGCNRNWLYDSLTDFVKKTGIPFINTQMGKGVVSHSIKGFIGTAALSDNDYVHKAVKKADLIINVGHDVVEKPPFFMHDGGTDVIHVNYNSAEIDEVYFPQIELIGSIGKTMNRLCEQLVERKNNFDLESFYAIREEISKEIHADDADDRYPMVPQRLVSDVRKALPKDAILALDNGVYKIWFARNFPTEMPNTVLLDNALATMGAGLPSAMMAAVLYPDRNVMAVCGDGGFMMNSQEMETAVRLKLNIVVLVLRDDSYGMIRWKQGHSGFEDWGLEFGNPDFVKYAESYGAKGHRVESTESFVDLIKSCYTEGGVHLIEAPIDYSENSKI